MKLNKLVAVTLAGTMAISLAACGGSKPAETTAAPAAAAPAAAAPAATEAAAPAAAGDFDKLDEVELIVADSSGVDSALQQFNQALAKNAEEITGGKLILDLHLNGELGGDADLIRQAQAGDIAIVGSQIAPLVSFVPEMAIFDLPMVFAKYSGDTIDKVLNGDTKTNAAINEAYGKASLKLLGFLQNATYRLTTANTEVKDLASFKGLKIRTMENANHMAFWTAIGAEPTPLAWAEVYISLQNGTIDAEENAADTVAGANFQEVQKYLANTNHILYCNQIAINADTWNDLDPAYQAALTEAVKKTLDEMRPKLESIDQDNKKALEEKGMTLIDYEDAFYDEILALDGVKELYSKIDGEVGGLGTTLQEELEANK